METSFNNLHFEFAYVSTDVATWDAMMKMERSSRASTAGPHSQKKAHLIHSSLSHISSGCMWKPPLVSRLVTHHQSVIISCPGAVSLWSGTGKSEPFLKGKFRG